MTEQEELKNWQEQRCNGCGHKREDLTYMAYFINHERLEGICKECKDRLEQEDLDTYTYDALGKLHDVVNGGNHKDLAESLYRSIQRQHRYLQNQFFMALAHFFKLYGETKESHYDIRNEGAVKMAKRWDKVSYDFNFNFDIK